MTKKLHPNTKKGLDQLVLDILDDSTLIPIQAWRKASIQHGINRVHALLIMNNLASDPNDIQEEK